MIPRMRQGARVDLITSGKENGDAPAPTPMAMFMRGAAPILYKEPVFPSLLRIEIQLPPVGLASQVSSLLRMQRDRGGLEASRVLKNRRLLLLRSMNTIMKQTRAGA